MTKPVKTNAMRILERMGIAFTVLSYESDGFTGGGQAAEKLGLAPKRVFKTLVTTGSDRAHYVFVIPTDCELDLKKCARSVGVKATEMLPQKDLLALTGYVRGGCTAIGMKKPFVTRLDRSAQNLETVCVSGGRIGCHLLLRPDDFLRAASAAYADLTMGEDEP